MRENGKVAEINLEAMVLSPEYPESLKSQYVEYLAWLREAGVPLSTGSDCHSPRYTEIRFEAAASVLESAVFKDEDFWRLPPRNIV